MNTWKTGSDHLHSPEDHHTTKTGAIAAALQHGGSVEEIAEDVKEASDGFEEFCRSDDEHCLEHKKKMEADKEWKKWTNWLLYIFKIDTGYFYVH